MTILTEEIPFTNEALKIYISSIKDRIKYLNKFVNEDKRLRLRLKKARERFESNHE